jgi:hypothetical protein
VYKPPAGLSQTDICPSSAAAPLNGVAGGGVAGAGAPTAAKDAVNAGAGASAAAAAAAAANADVHACSGVAAAPAGVFRTNCIDCLDRTNVVQGVLGRKALEGLLAELGVVAPGATLAAALPKVCDWVVTLFG